MVAIVSCVVYENPLNNEQKFFDLVGGEGEQKGEQGSS
jgi:hypothetical protein